MKKNYLKTAILSLAVLGLVGSQSVRADGTVYQGTLAAVPDESYALNSTGTKDFYYALLDIDQNGQEELVVAEKANDGLINPLALYYANQQTATLLVGKIFGPSGSINFKIYEDGTVQVFDISRGSGDILEKLYQLPANNGEATLIQEAAYKVGDRGLGTDVSGKTEVDLTQLDYKSLAEPIISEAVGQAVQKQEDLLLPKTMREAAIGQEIAFPSELAGVWTTVETPNGTKPGRPSTVEIAGDGSYVSIYTDGNLIGNMTTLRKVSENGFVILSDGAQNGIFGIVGIGGNPGPNARTEFGIVLEGQTLKNVSWTVTNGAEDYSNPKVLATFTNPNYVVKEEPVLPSTSSSETKASSVAQTSEKGSNTERQKQEKLFGILPMTGEIFSVLGIVGVILIGLAFYIRNLKKK